MWVLYTRQLKKLLYKIIRKNIPYQIPNLLFVIKTRVLCGTELFFLKDGLPEIDSTIRSTVDTTLQGSKVKQSSLVKIGKKNKTANLNIGTKNRNLVMGAL